MGAPPRQEVPTRAFWVFPRGVTPLFCPHPIDRPANGLAVGARAVIAGRELGRAEPEKLWRIFFTCASSRNL